jgi:hypothetical protein
MPFLQRELTSVIEKLARRASIQSYVVACAPNFSVNRLSLNSYFHKIVQDRLGFISPSSRLSKFSIHVHRRDDRKVVRAGSKPKVLQLDDRAVIAEIQCIDTAI